jgi:hypothetical protein
MPIFALTTLQKLKQVPAQLWVYLALGVLGLCLVVYAARRLRHLNAIVWIVIGCFVCGLLFFNWVYERNEPKFLTPVVEKIAPFFPSKIDYNKKQNDAPKR